MRSGTQAGQLCTGRCRLLLALREAPAEDYRVAVDHVAYTPPTSLIAAASLSLIACGSRPSWIQLTSRSESIPAARPASHDRQRGDPAAVDAGRNGLRLGGCWPTDTRVERNKHG
jgi:hypothetical protein